MNAKTEEITIDIKRVMEMIPHRYPFLLIDRIVECEPGVRAVGLKNVTLNEPHFQGHFPGHPVMPGVLIIESMAQTAALMMIQRMGEKAEGKIVYFISIDEARFRKPVVPGDSMYIHVEKLHERANVWKFKAQAKVNGAVCAEATYSAMVNEKIL